jgi:hypothetical protein
MEWEQLVGQLVERQFVERQLVERQQLVWQLVECRRLAQ